MRKARPQSQVAVLALVLCVLLGLFAVQIRASQSQAHRIVEQRYLARATVTARLTTSVFASSVAASLPRMANVYGAERVPSSLLASAAARGHLEYLVLLAPDGRIIASSPGVTPAMTRGGKLDSPGVSAVLAGQGFSLSSPPPPNPTNIEQFVQPVQTPFGRRVLVSGVGPQAITAFVSGYLSGAVVSAGEAYVLDAGGGIIASSRLGDVAGTRLRDPRLLAALVRGGEGPVGDGRQFASAAVGDSNWSVVLVAQRSRLFASVEQGRLVPWLLFGALALAGAAAVALLRGLGRGAVRLARTNDELKAAKETLEERFADVRRSEARMAEAQEIACVGSWEWDVGDATVRWSRELRRIYGLDPDVFSGPVDGILEFVHPDDRERVRRTLATAVADGTSFAFDHRIVRPDGDVRTIHALGEVVTDASGRAVAMTGTGQDITERRRTELALEAAHADALESSRLKSEFVANMSHEIRTPLNGVIGMSGLLLETGLDAEQREYAEAVRASGDVLMALIEDVLDFSKVEAGKLELVDEAFDLRSAVEGAVGMLAGSAHAKRLELIATIDDGLPIELSGDAPRLRQILVNLLTNAVKFTSAGEVVLGVTGEADADGGVLMRFEISDTGIGIDRSAQERIFDSFSQADSSTTRRYGGTGLGLAISKALVELMGGEIGVESTPGAGSLFWFTARLATLPAAAEVAVAAGSGVSSRVGYDGLRVLVVDDNATHRAVLAGQLAGWGMACDSAPGGEEALATMRAAAQTGKPHRLVVLDSRMPGISGTQLAARIRADPLLGAARLLLMTSSGDGRATEAASGVDGFVTKPVRRSRLVDELDRVLSGPADRPVAGNASGVSGDGAVGRPPRGVILVAEDNEVNQLVAIRLLEKRGFSVDVAANGRIAVEMHEHGSYDAILMDCQMPELDGYAATAEIRRREGRGRHIPIIAMTAHAMKGDRERCLRAGMDDYVRKPVGAAVLDDVLARAVWCAASPPEEPGDVDRLDDPDGSLPAVFDPRLLAEISDGDEAIRQQLVAMFLEQARTDVPRLAIALARGDAGKAREVAHALKGSAAAVGADRLADAAARLCADAEAGRLDDAVRDQSALEQACALTEAALTGIVAVGSA